MASSDEEGEILPDNVTNYQLVDGRDQPVSFSCITLQQSVDDIDVADGLKARIYLQGTTCDGLETIYKQVIGWKYDLSSVEPEIFVLCKGNYWIQLQKPRKCFEVIIRTTLVTIHFLHFMKNNPHAPEKVVWNHLSQAFSSCDVQPCEKDISDHIALVKDAFKSDLNLSESEYMHELLSEQPRKRKLLLKDRKPMKKPSFVVDDSEEELPIVGVDDAEDIDCDPLEKERLEEEAEDLDFPHASQEESKLGGEEEKDGGDYCCAFCDNGGHILCCEGPCMRSFHPTIASGENFCRSLGLSQAQVDRIPVFFCKNCQYKKHQCSICGKLGSSDDNSAPEVFPCVSATCGRFYHARCVANALYPENTTKARQFEAQVAAGCNFTCPGHKCFVCGHGEDRNIHALQFAVCRRCPKAYHRKCLPRNISFHSYFVRNVQQRAWDDLLPKRILIYCLDHEIIPSLGTPARNHIVFPVTCAEKKKCVIGQAAIGEGTVEKKENVVANFSPLKSSPVKKPCQANNTGVIVCGLKVTKDVQGVKTFRNAGKVIGGPGFHIPRKTNFVEGSSKFSTSHGRIPNNEASHAPSSSGRNFVLKLKKSEGATVTVKPVTVKKSHPMHIKESKIESRMKSLIEDVNSSFDINNVINHQKTVSSYATREISERNITMGKIEAAVKAVQTALEKLDGGGTIEEAKAICEPDMLDQLARWKHKLGFYLGPFLHGMRYSSYGRHFTKFEKLMEIVNRLHWYVQDGDMIVDFSCGSNDFSCLMSRKLESVSKRCFFKNYDIFQAKNDFNFEKRDWFSVRKEELPDGSRLIIGLNPPFGKIADRFINQALQFNPKLIILIVPRENQRLDQKPSHYDLIWDDPYLLAGKSFYLPGSIDVHNKQMEQWNLVSPPICLWSHPDWSERHRKIAMTYNHLAREIKDVRQGQNQNQSAMLNYVMEENRSCYGDCSSLRNEYAALPRMLDDIPEKGDGYEPQHSDAIFESQAQSPVSMDID